MLIGHIPAAAVAVSHMRMGGSIKVALAADVQAGVVVYTDKLGAGGTFAIVIVQGLIGHQQLQKLVAARAQRADLRDGIGIVEHRAEAGDAALHLAFNEQVGRRKAALRAGVLPGGVGNVVDHHAHDAPIAALGFAGQRVGIVRRQCGKAGSGLLACRQRGGSHSLRGCSRRGGAGRAGTESLLEPGREITAQNGAARSAAAGKRQRCSGSTGKTENGTTSELHTKNLLLKTVSVWPGRTPVPEKADGCSTAGQKTRRGADGFDLIVTVLPAFVKRKLSGGSPHPLPTPEHLRPAARMESGSPHRCRSFLRLFAREPLHFCASCGNIIRQYVHCRNMRS